MTPFATSLNSQSFTFVFQRLARLPERQLSCELCSLIDGDQSRHHFDAEARSFKLSHFSNS